MKVLYECIWCRFGCPIELVSDQGPHFINDVVANLTSHYTVMHRRSTSYYPQENGLAESTNKILQSILRKIVNEHLTDWDRKFQFTLWVYRTSYKTSIGSTPFYLTYGLEVFMPIQFKVPNLRIQVQEHLLEDELRIARAEQLLCLDDERFHSERRLE